MLENSDKIKNMAKGSSCYSMQSNHIKESFLMINLMDWENLFTQMGTLMKDHLNKIKNMVLENTILIKHKIFLKEHGYKT